MAGVGLRLNKFFNKKSMSSHIAGAGYSIVITIAPMLLVIVTLIIMQRLLGYTQESYYEKQLFQNTVLYIFIFSLLASAPLNAVLSRYISDVIFEETYADIMPCYYLGLLIQTLFCCLMGIPFCLHEWLSGGVRPAYVFISFCCFIALSFIFYTMMYLSICKDYKDFTFLCCWKYNQPFLIVIFSILYRYQCLYVHAACSDCRLFNYGIPWISTAYAVFYGIQPPI